MTQKAHSPAGPEDPDAFREACAVFGEAGALDRLQVFRSELSEQLAQIARGTSDRQALRELVHRTVGRAGVLGFPTLAEASSTLDEALLCDQGVAAAMERWMQEARDLIERV